MSRFDNISLVVNEQGITIDSREIEWDDNVNSLFHDYTDYLDSIEKEKSPEAIQHDVKLLYTLRMLRSSDRSPLKAGVLFLTCDRRLYHFDLKDSRKKGRNPTVILPTVMLQIVRPIIQKTDDFDSLFANTFALPEFRSYSKMAAKASEKIAEILAAHEGLPDSVAEQLLMDEILVREVQIAPPEDRKEVVDTAIGKKFSEISQALERERAIGVEREKEEKALVDQRRRAEREVEHRLVELEAFKKQFDTLKSSNETLQEEVVHKDASLGEKDSEIGKLQSKLYWLAIGAMWLLALVLIILFGRLAELIDLQFPGYRQILSFLCLGFALTSIPNRKNRSCVWACLGIAVTLLIPIIVPRL